MAKLLLCCSFFTSIIICIIQDAKMVFSFLFLGAWY